MKSMPAGDDAETLPNATRRRGASSTTLAATAATIVLCLPGWLHAAPEHVRISYTGPTESSMTISWNTNGNVGTEVRYGTAAGNLGSSETGTSFAATGALGYVHEVTLNGLTPDTIYYYQAGETGDGFSPEHSFTTALPPDENCGEFKFTFIGDNRLDPFLPGSGQDYDTILNQIVADQPAFLINGGDLVYDGQDIDQWLEYFTYNDPEVASLPNMPALGNHDDGPGEGDSAVYNQLFALPRSADINDTEDYYYFTYGNVLVASLSTDSFNGGAIPFQDQADWLDGVFTANPRKWKIVFFHKPVYATEVLFGVGVSHDPNEEGQNEAFVDVFDKHHVDVVLTSHNHWYERYGPSNCSAVGTPGSDEPCPVGDPSQGTIYIVSGGGGATAIPGGFCLLPPSPVGRASCAGGHHYLLFDVQNENLTVEAWGAHPAAHTLVDSFSITKPTTDCAPILPDGGVGGAGVGGSGTGATGWGGAGTGATGAGASGTGNSGTGANAQSPQDDGGCGCRTSPSRGSLLPVAGVLAALALARRRRRRAA